MTHKARMKWIRDDQQDNKISLRWTIFNDTIKKDEILDPLYTLIDETIVSVREEVPRRHDMKQLISLGLDPLIYRTEYFHDYSGNQAVYEKWWGTFPYHIMGDTLVNSLPAKEGFTKRGLASSPSPIYENSMY